MITAASRIHRILILAIVLAVGVMCMSNALAEASLGDNDLVLSQTPVRMPADVTPGSVMPKYSSHLGFTRSRITLYVDDNYEIPWYVRWIDGYSAPALTSSNYGIVEVYEDEGIYYAYADRPGTAKIWIRYAGRKASMKVVVKYRPIEEFSLDPEFENLPIGKTAYINASIYPYGTSDKVSWKSSNKSIAKVDGKGKVTGVKPGYVTITATAANGWKRSYSFWVYDPVVRRALVIVEGSATNGSYSGESDREGEIKSTTTVYHGMCDLFARNKINASGLMNPWNWEEARGMILSAFSDADEDDISYLYINAHGGYDQGSGFYWACVGNYNSGSYWVSAETLRQTLDQIPGRKVLLMDTCHSGAVIGKGAGDRPGLDARGFVRAFMASKGGKLTAKTAEMLGSEYYVICSASMYNLSWYFWDWRNLVGERRFTGTAYAYSLSRGSGWNICQDKKLKFYADSNHNGKVSVYELGKYTAGYMKKIYKAARVSEPATVCVYPENSSFVLF